MTEKTYVVEGMTCGHCTASVQEEVSELDGVEVLEVDLESGRLVVRGETVDDDAVRSAVTEAGYALRA